MEKQDNYTRWIDAGVEELEHLANGEGIWEQRLRFAAYVSYEGDEE